MNDRFTEKARNAIEKARAAAMELGHSYIGTEHLCSASCAKRTRSARACCAKTALRKIL